MPACRLPNFAAQQLLRQPQAGRLFAGGAGEQFRRRPSVPARNRAATTPAGMRNQHRSSRPWALARLAGSVSVGLRHRRTGRFHAAVSTALAALYPLGLGVGGIAPQLEREWLVLAEFWQWSIRRPRPP